MRDNKSPVFILGIETSCDETAISVVRAADENIEVLSNTVSSQVKLHAKWGGVVPNLAAREHLKNILPVLNSSLSEAKMKIEDIDLICVTNGPGLIPALLIGTNTAKTLSYLLQKPLLGIHHIEGHIYANFIGVNSKFEIRNSKFPILCLVVSGGHTQLVLMKKHLDYEIVGETLDDAAGEAFDKVARILKLGYPGGPAIATAADHCRLNAEKHGKIQRHSALNPQKSALGLPRPMINSNNLNFSFSGLKTAVLYTVKKHSDIFENVRMSSQLCAEFQQAVVDVLVAKTLKAAAIYQPKTVMLAGGVSANQELRLQLGKAIKKELGNIYPVKSAKGGAKQFNGTRYIIPDTLYSIDNAAMIAAAGYYRFRNMSAAQKKKTFANWKELKTDANLKL